MSDGPADPVDDLHFVDAEAGSPRTNGLQGRPWVGVRFDCCGVYTRLYRNREGTAYRGFCPRCMRSVRLRVGARGTESRFFIAE